MRLFLITHKQNGTIPSSPYSHGLEEHYRLETVDIQTVKTFAPFTKKEKNKTLTSSCVVPQLPLPLGPSFDRALPTLRLHESTRALALSPFAKRALDELRVSSLQELRTLMPSLEQRKIRGLGQGHVDEIVEKYHSYMSGYLSQNSLLLLQTFEIALLPKLLLDQMPHTLQYHLFSQYALGHLISLTAAENNEYQKMAQEQRQSLCHNALQQAIEKRGSLIRSLLHDIACAFIHPFLEKRHGIASSAEIEECIMNHCHGLDRQECEKLLTMLSTILQTSFLFEASCVHIGKTHYAANTEIANDLQDIQKAAARYFPHVGMRYRFETLVDYLKRDFSKKWKGYPEGFIERALSYSELFSLFRDEQGHLAICFS